MSLCLSLSQFERYNKIDSPDECKQLRKHPKALTKANHEAWCFSTSKIKINCYKDCVTQGIYKTCFLSLRNKSFDIRFTFTTFLQPNLFTNFLMIAR